MLLARAQITPVQVMAAPMVLRELRTALRALQDGTTFVGAATQCSCLLLVGASPVRRREIIHTQVVVRGGACSVSVVSLCPLPRCRPVSCP
jgi:hypothetical protein